MNKTEKGREFLAHFGVRGMRWGVRTGGASGSVKKSSIPKPVTTQTTGGSGLLSGKTKVLASGGKGHPPTADAIKAAVIKQKLKKSGPAALSNGELQGLATRLNLENQVKTLAATPGQKFVDNLVKDSQKNAGRSASNAGQEFLKKKMAA